MKNLLLSTEDIQNFSKLIHNQKASALPSDDPNSCNLMALQYYLKHSGSYPTATTQTQLQRTQKVLHVPSGGAAHHHHQPQQQQPASHQQALAHSQTQLKHLQLKQPTVHQQHINYHHPYYQQTAAHVAAANHHSSAGATNHTAAGVPVHALNQNSNFSAASSSTGGGTASSHAPTQQSNTTGSSFSPPNANVNIRSAPAKNANSSSALNPPATRAANNNSSTKKLKTEPVLSQFHQSERLTFANTHHSWVEEHWKRVIFQDERKFNLDGPDGFAYYYHDLRNYERTLSQRPRGYSVYIYIMISAGGPIHLEVATTRQSPETCIETILRERANIVTKLGGNTEFVLQDHNWTANALPTAQEWLNAEGIKIQKWPTVSHDLNIMENIWGWLIREVYDGGRKFSRKDDLIFRIKEAWARLPMDLVTNLYSTLPERIMELYYTRGIYTNC